MHFITRNVKPYIHFRHQRFPLCNSGRFFTIFLLDRAEAEDVVQDTMIRVWSKRDEWSQFESVEAYCLIVAKNLAIDRSQKKEAQNVELTPEMEEEPYANSPYDRMIHDEKMNIINRLVNELPEKQRLIMQLRTLKVKAIKKLQPC